MSKLLIVMFLLLLLIFPVTGNSQTIFEANFDIDADGFTYVDDIFRGTAQPNYAGGVCLSTGGFSGGVLQVILGGLDNTDINNMSGGWERSFSLSVAENIIISFRYKLGQSGNYESDEPSQVLFSLDGQLLGQGGEDFLAQIAGDGNGGPQETTGWQVAYINLGLLDAGNFNIAIGAYNKKKTLSDEWTELLIDDVRFVHNNITPFANAGPDLIVSVASDGDLAAVVLNGRDSYDVDGLIANYEWKKNGSLIATGDSVVVNLGIGQYTITLTVTDDSSAIAVDEVMVTINSRAAAAELVNGLNIEDFKNDIKTLSDFGDRSQSGAGSQSYTNAENWVVQQLESFGYTVECHPFSYQGYPRNNLYVTKIGKTYPDRMYIITAHLDGRGSGGAANDNGSGSSLVLESARIFAPLHIETDISVRFIWWTNEETGLNGSKAYVSDRAALQGIENPPGSGLYPEPTWLGLINPDMILFDHGVPPQPDQIPGADMDVDYQINSTFSQESQALALALQTGSSYYSTDYPAEVRSNMSNTDSYSFINYTASVSLRENNRLNEIGNGSNPQWHQTTDVFATYSEADFRLGFNILQMAVGTVAELAGAKVTTTPVPGLAENIPSQFYLEQNYPNPFYTKNVRGGKLSTEIAFFLNKTKNVRIFIYDIHGKVVKILTDKKVSSGRHFVTWAGKNETGSFVPSGLYFYKFQAGEFSQTRKMLLVR